MNRKIYLAAAVPIAVLMVGFSTTNLRSSTSVSPPDCQPSPEVQVCLGEWAVDNIKNLNVVVSTLTMQSLKDPVFAGACHDAWHALGKAAGLEYDLSRALDPWTYSCTGGYLHGVMSTSPIRSGFKKFADSIPDFCARYKSRPKVVYLDCWHGAGHGFAQVRAFPESMYACEPIAPGPEELEWCTWGAAEFPDGTTRTNSQEVGPHDGSMLKSCGTLRVGHQACYRLVLPIMNMSGRPMHEMRGYCYSQPAEHRDYCMFSLGSVVGMKYVKEPASVLECKLSPVHEGSCAAGFGRYMGRLFEWGMFSDDPEKSTAVLNACAEFDEGPSRRCEEEFRRVRDIELSPDEEREVIKGW